MSSSIDIVLSSTFEATNKIYYGTCRRQLQLVAGAAGAI